MPTRWGKPTEDEKWAEEMQQRKRRARILFIRRVVVAVVALAAIGGTLMWLLNVFNRQIGDCFDSHGELTYHKERCLAYGPPTFEVWLFAVGSVVIGLLAILSIVSLIVTSTGRARSKCSCEGTCEHEQARQNALAMGIALGVIFGSSNNN